MELNSDQKIQKLFNQIQYTDPSLLCGSKSKITLLCINKQCKAHSLHCQNQKCTFCQPHLEKSCNSFQLRSLTSLMKRKSQNLKYLVQQMIKIETNMFKLIQNKRTRLIQKGKYGNLTQLEIHIVQSIFKKPANMHKFKGSQILDLIEKLKTNNETFKIQGQINVFKKQIREITSKIFQLQNNTINEVLNPTKHYAKIDSHIMEHDQVGLGFILQQLNHPLELKMLYRASQNGFSAQEFHKKCDNKPNTLTIIRTVHNKVIAGFTPLTWDSSSDRYKTDPNLETFVLSVTHRKKYQLKIPQKAIVCIKNCGPIFGKNDFALINGDSTNGTKIFIDFPQIFKCNQASENTLQAIQKVLGQKKGKYVGVNEYEVYEVLNFRPQRRWSEFFR